MHGVAGPNPDPDLTPATANGAVAAHELAVGVAVGQGAHAKQHTFVPPDGRPSTTR